MRSLQYKVFVLLTAVLLVGAGCGLTATPSSDQQQPSGQGLPSAQQPVAAQPTAPSRTKPVVPPATNANKAVSSANANQALPRPRAVPIGPLINTNASAPSSTGELGSELGDESLPSAEVPAGQKVNIRNFSFQPASLTVRAGTVVTWVNQDEAPHQIASDPHPEHTALPDLLSAPLSEGETYSYTFTTPGTWKYHCHLHSSMGGSVIVE